MSYSKEFLKTTFEQLFSLRLSEEKLVEIYALGKVPGHIHSGVGEEAAYVGTLATKNPGDYYKAGHRSVSATQLMGITYDQIFGEILGKATGTSGGRGGVNHIGTIDSGILGTAGSLGCDMVVSIGAGLSAKYLNNGRIVYSYYGDGTSSRGTLHEAMNLAAIWKLPVLFICTNNQYAISANYRTTIPVENPGADRAAAYGMPSRIADGNDVFAVYEATKELVEYIRAGNGPAVLETKGYRWRGHYEGDQAHYRDAKVTEEEMKKDCVKKLESYILDNKVMTQGEIDELRQKVNDDLDAAIARAEAAPETPVSELYDHLYA